MSPNETEAAAAWDAIESGHGDVAVDPRWAASRGLPPSFLHPLDSTRMVYVVEAYHAIHCLVRVSVLGFSSRLPRRCAHCMKANYRGGVFAESTSQPLHGSALVLARENVAGEYGARRNYDNGAIMGPRSRYALL